MATGISQKNGYKNNKEMIVPFRLEYEGKIPIEEILKTQPAKLQRVISVDKEPRNQLIYGENLRVLSSLIRNDAVIGKVGLI